MISIITIILFFIYTWGLGFTATYFVSKPKEGLERLFLNMGIGLGILPIIFIIINFLRLPLDWRIFLFLSLAFPVYLFFKEKKYHNLIIPSFKFTKSTIAILLVLAISLISLFMYTKGAFSYPYLENEDPWGHSVGAKYVSIEKDAYDPPFMVGSSYGDLISYVDPYPPAYDVLMGVLHQTSPNLTWTLKFFNSLIISLGFIFFYLFAKNFIKDRNKALFATFIFAAIPSYLSHFIWAHSLTVTIFFPTIYAFDMIKEDKRWISIAVILVASLWVSQMISQPLKLTTLLLIYAIVTAVIYRNHLKKYLTAILGGFILSFFWWGPILKKHTVGGLAAAWGSRTITDAASSASSGISLSNVFEKIFSLTKTVTDPGGSGSRAYVFNDFFFAKGQNMINNPIGVGVVISLLVLVGLVYFLLKHRHSITEKKMSWFCVSLFWLVFTFWAVNGSTFPISIARVSFRSWMIMAIPVAIVAAEGFYFLKDLSKSKKIKYLITFLVILGIIFTSAQQKYELNTAIWPTSGSFTSQSEPFAYAAWLNTIPDNTKVFLYSPRDKLIIGLSKFSCMWCKEIIDFREEIIDKDADQLHRFLKEQNYEYIIINGVMDFKHFSNKYGENKTKEIIPKIYNEMAASNLFTLVYQQENNFAVMKIN